MSLCVEPQRDWNVSTLLAKRAVEVPNKVATIIYDGAQMNFSQMEFETRRMAAIYRDSGMTPGMRVATFVRPGLDFVSSIFGLFRVGAIPVFIDPGMKVANMVACVEESGCEAMVGIPLAFVLRWLHKKSFSNIAISLCLTKRPWISNRLGAIAVEPVMVGESVLQLDDEEFFVVEAERETPAAILFTSGSTGIPKGVEVTHGVLWGQQSILRSSFEVKDDEVDMVPFPLFALFSAVWGITSVIPDMNPAKPSKCSGKKLTQLMLDHGVTHTAGSPAIWKNVLQFAQKKELQFPKLKRILMAGAPVAESLVIGWQDCLSEIGHIYTPYGATEALPVSVVRDDELIDDCYRQTKAGRGTCVGRPMGDVKIKVVAIQDKAVEHFDDLVELGTEQIGEIIVQGPLVTKRYFNRPHATHNAKINDWNKSGTGFWHRMGDVGYFDKEGRLWFCGRKDHRVQLGKSKELYPVQIEPIFNSCNGVKRSALVGVPDDGELQNRPVLMVEALKKDRKVVRQRVLDKAQESILTTDIQEVLFVEEFPTDVRHNIKIDRPELSRQAQRELCE